jgi:hypothetical protein
MDLSIFAPLGLAIAEIPMVAAVVNPTVNQIKSTFDIDRRVTLILAYALSFVLMFLLAIVVDQNLLGAGWPITLAKTVVAGWIAATYAGQITETQRMSDAKVASRRRGVAPVVVTATNHSHIEPPGIY